MEAVFSFVFEKSELQSVLKNSAQPQTLILSSVVSLLNTTFCFLNLLLFEMFRRKLIWRGKKKFSSTKVLYGSDIVSRVMALKTIFSYPRNRCLWKSSTICENPIVPRAYTQGHVSKRFQILTPVSSLQVEIALETNSVLKVQFWLELNWGDFCLFCDKIGFRTNVQMQSLNGQTVRLWAICHEKFQLSWPNGIRFWNMKN